MTDVQDAALKGNEPVKSVSPLPRVWVRPVRPQEYPGFSTRKVKPVTRADLSGTLQFGALRGFGYDASPVPPPATFRPMGT